MIFRRLRRYGQSHRGTIASPTTIHWLLISVGLAMAPHLWRMPAPVVAVCLLGFGWRLGSELRGWPLPPSALRVLLLALAVATVMFEYGALYGKIAGSSLLATLLALKLTETRNVRDVEFALFLSYFVIVTGFFFDQGIPTALLTVASFTLITGTLISAHDTSSPRMSPARFRKVGSLVLQGLPLMLVLFVLFPRASGPLWSWPRDEAQGISGLSDTMSPGSISNLILSDEVAFRVDFEGRPPSENKLYWRALVFGRFDGRTWHSLEHEMAAPEHWIALPEDPVAYTVTMEPTHQQWMFALDVLDPGTRPANTRLTADFRLVRNKDVSQRLRYSVVSHASYLMQSQPGDLPAYVRRQNLVLPNGTGARARELAASWRSDSANGREVIERALAHFSGETFRYTLSPRLLDGDPIDGFLFETREGYCEHYSSAFTFLMRAAGLPARVVTGYQGGEFNPVGQYMIVPQANAHAWTEVWLENEGWVRVDPTAAVAPSRVADGLAALGNEVDLPSIIARGDDGLIRQLSLVWDAVNNGWNQFVLGYGIRHQYLLLEWLGFSRLNRGSLLLALMVALSAVLLTIAAWVFFRRSRPSHPALAIYRRYLRRLKRRTGADLLPGEPPLAFCERISGEHPDESGQLRRVTKCFLDAYYRPDAGEHALSALRQALSR